MVDCCTPSSCCGGNNIDDKNYYTLPYLSTIHTPVGPIPSVSVNLSREDVVGSWKVRWNMGRMNYAIKPGLYGAGTPNEDSPVLVTANYKLSFDALRKELTAINAWILVLDTKGINVWCAAGKGTFGTEELVKQLAATQLHQVVTHRSLILPQLGAPGIAAHQIYKFTGFKVIYGPVRASDLPGFLAANNKATKEMRQVNFNLVDRATVVPVEIMQAIKPSFYVLIGMALVTAIVSLSSWHMFWGRFFGFAIAYIGSVLVGTTLVPLLLPYIPSPSFTIKGWLAGLAWIAIFVQVWSLSGNSFTTPEAIGLYLLMPPVAAYLSLNFTGCTTYTSQSGVQKEMNLAIPAMGLSSILGVLIIFSSLFL
ncbi:MAG: mercury methylation corrinoid protein HgcA [Bacillota bacterium]|nr:mercury methylation corrinoid protein HgcA [Bacillota bacterium]